MAKKAILFIMDGLGNIEKPKTPLEKAKTPNLDRLAKEGVTGMLYPLGKGVIPQSDKSHLVLFGYDLKKDYCGRGPLEALGAGIKLRKGDIAFRGNFATVKDGGIIDRRAGRIDTNSAKKLEKEIPKKIEDVKIIFKSTVEHRGALVLRGKGLSENITNSDPHRLGPLVKCKSKDGKRNSKKTAGIVNKFTELVFEKLSKSKVNKNRKLPANIVLLRGAGKYRVVKPFRKKFGIKAACVAGGALYKGVAGYVGMDIINVMGATGDKNTDLKAKGRAVIKSLKNHGLVFLHVKATDSFSHDGNCEGKRNILEKIDKELIPLLPRNNSIVAITGDHSTPCSKGKHSSDPVPLLIYGNEKDSVERFGERYCKKGKLGKIEGKVLMGKIIKLIKEH